MKHHPFLRNGVMAYPADTLFPEALELRPDEGPTDLTWIRETERGAVVFVASAGCEACRLEPAIEVMRDDPELAYAVFYEGDEEALERLRREVADLPCRVYRCDIFRLAQQTPIRVVPYMLAVRPDGHAAASGLFNTYGHAARIAGVLGVKRSAAAPSAP
ncbi:hypothetical protein [Cohnella sp. REN36]|uniref:hypothetical protein n=1 Tax=Cohnella sp. REN36 TaxID=2887347 RepID=UPI001D1375FC|nr:hypothetical protein [Cohnella sp. REN36]MCC3374577.1 hypothetical protein [Cohnella sp. REN36]